jgi:hypothetical protein
MTDDSWQGAAGSRQPDDTETRRDGDTARESQTTESRRQVLLGTMH